MISHPDFETADSAARSFEVPIVARSRREAVPVLVVHRADGDAAGAPVAGDATLAA
jgi:hypothetical protein